MPSLHFGAAVGMVLQSRQPLPVISACFGALWKVFNTNGGGALGVVGAFNVQALLGRAARGHPDRVHGETGTD